MVKKVLIAHEMFHLYMLTDEFEEVVGRITEGAILLSKWRVRGSDSDAFWDFMASSSQEMLKTDALILLADNATSALTVNKASVISYAPSVGALFFLIVHISWLCFH